MNRAPDIWAPDSWAPDSWARGPTVRGPIVRFSEMDNWAPDSWARGPTVRGPVVHFLEVDNWAPDSWAPGELSSRIVVFGPYRALRGENTISKRCVQFTILDSILIFLPNIWVSYQVGLLSLGPIRP